MMSDSGGTPAPGTKSDDGAWQWDGERWVSLRMGPAPTASATASYDARMAERLAEHQARQQAEADALAAVPPGHDRRKPLHVASPSQPTTLSAGTAFKIGFSAPPVRGCLACSR